MFNLHDKWICTKFDLHSRIDTFLAKKSPLSRSQIQFWIKKGCITLNQKIAHKNLCLKQNDIITIVKILEQPPSSLIPEEIKLDIVYEDQDLAVIHKPKNMVVHPGAGNYTGTLVNALIWHYKNLSNHNGNFRPGILHRLDKDTSGLIVITKNNLSHQNLAAQIQTRVMKRTYYALTWKNPKLNQGIIDKPIKRDPNHRVKMCIHSDGRNAISHYKTLNNFTFSSFIKVKLQTGRTHQIRVHMDSINTPVIGDPVYGKGSFNIKELPYSQQASAHKLQQFFTSQALHAGNLSFLHPKTNQLLSFSIPLPKNMKDALNFLNSTSNN